MFYTLLCVLAVAQMPEPPKIARLTGKLWKASDGEYRLSVAAGRRFFKKDDVDLPSSTIYRVINGDTVNAELKEFVDKDVTVRGYTGIQEHNHVILIYHIRDKSIKKTLEELNPLPRIIDKIRR